MSGDDTTDGGGAPRVETVDLDGLRAWLDERPLSRALLLTSRSRRWVDRVRGVLFGFEVAVFDEAEVHVPRATVERAGAALKEAEADVIIAVGGGSAIGLGKALRLEHQVAFVAVPTTYAGSEMTTIYGVSEGGEKRTGRDERVRPDVVVYEGALTAGLPAKLTVTSLCNALAHPISALSTGELDDVRRDDVRRDDALAAIGTLCRALRHLAASPRNVRARGWALWGAAAAGRVLDASALGRHHQAAHRLGGRFGCEHSALHSVLLPHTVRALPDDTRDAIEQAAGVVDFAGWLFDTLRRVGAATALSDLGVEHAGLVALVGEHDLPRWVFDAFHGRRPARSLRPSTLAAKADASDGVVGGLVCSGAYPAEADRLVVALHGRGASAGAVIEQVRACVGDAPDVAIIAIEAADDDQADNAWYPESYREAPSARAEASLGRVAALLDRVLGVVPGERVVLFGFSQGACLAAEALARRAAAGAAPIGGLVALSGARLGPSDAYAPPASDDEDDAEPSAADGRCAGMAVLLAIAEADPWVDAADVEATAAFFRAAGASVTLLSAPGDAHELRARERIAARALILGDAPATAIAADSGGGFGGAHASEGLPGALPLAQNSPRRAPYGLLAEQINGTGFGARRAHNLRCWLYRIRQATQLSTYAPLSHPTLCGDFGALPPDPNLSGFRSQAIPDTPTDFVDGLWTFGGAGSAALRRGFAIHLYVANRSMEHRAFYNADGDFLLVPSSGRLLLQTELGVLEVGPGQLAILPRDIKFSVLLVDAQARGYVAEVFGRHFELPERGVIGSNGLADERHFIAPTAWHEDRLDPGFRIVGKLGGALFEATQDYSPFDVVAWHGNYSPYVYDLSRFSPVGAVRVDHPDPSIYTVLSAPLDEQGSNALDFVFFPPRWETAEDTFRPPYFHRNATTEFNGIIQDPSLAPDGPFYAGGCFLTPPMTAHGVLARSVEREIDADRHRANRPQRLSPRAMWFQFETSLPVALTPWAREAEHRVDNWHDEWGIVRPYFDPTSR